MKSPEEIAAVIAELDGSIAVLDFEIDRVLNNHGMPMVADGDSLEALQRDWHRAFDLRAQLLWVLS